VLFALVVSCDTADLADPYKGFIDASGLDAKFLPGKCGTAPCYPSQQGFAHGAPFFFYNVGTVTTSAVPVLKVSAAPTAYQWAQGHCRTVDGYDPMQDRYASANQFPLFGSLPLAPKSASVFVSPFVNVVPIASNEPFTCNDLKDAQWVGADGGTPGKFSPVADTTSEVRLWAVIDPTAPLAPSSPDFTVTTAFGWYKDLLLTYLDGGPVPVNDKGELVAMDGVILDPAGATTFAKGTDPKVVLVPFVRGEAGYSPIVKLHSWRLPAGKVPGDYTGLCRAPNCGPKDVDLAAAAATSFTTLFVVAQ
jgi:hypothetical protein